MARIIEQGTKITVIGANNPINAAEEFAQLFRGRISWHSWMGRAHNDFPENILEVQIAMPKESGEIFQVFGFTRITGDMNKVVFSLNKKDLSAWEYYRQVYMVLHAG